MSVLSPYAKMQAKGVKTQQKFVEMRIKTLNKASNVDAAKLEECVRNAYYDVKGVPCPDGLWADIYTRISDRLRSADLTVNFKSSSWFSADNTFGTYAQMYERALDRTTGVVNFKDDASNPGDVRAVVDDQVTLPGKWAKKSIFSEKRKVYDRMSFSGSSVPSTSAEQVKRAYGESKKSKLEFVGQDNSGNNNYHTKNSKFNPFAKQVFAALNYGRRPHGSSTFYGRSYFVLRSELKKGCLYFGQDTFVTQKSDEKTYLKNTKRDRTGTQSTYDWIGHILIWTNNDMRKQVFRSCYENETLEDTRDAMDLLEAHIFSDVHMNRDVEEVVLAREPATTGQEWETIKTNCYAWAERNKVRVIMNDA